MKWDGHYNVSFKISQETFSSSSVQLKFWLVGISIKDDEKFLQPPCLNYFKVPL